MCEWIMMATQGEEEEDDMEVNSWTPVASRRGQEREKSGKEMAGGHGSQKTKRGLEENSSDEGSSRVMRKRILVGEFKVIVRFNREDEQINLSPIMLSKELRKKVGDVEVVKTLRDGNLMIICRSEEQKTKAMQIESICRKKVRETVILGGKRVTRGVITGIPVDEDLEKLRRVIVGGSVSDIKRLQRSRNGERGDSLSVLLEFEDQNLPERVKVGCMSFPVRPYSPPPLRCFKCQRYGHIAAVCKGKQRCSKCGGDHRIEECRDEGQGKCCNCGGQHQVTYAGCEVRKKAVEIQKVKTVNNISYAEAVKKVQQQKGVYEPGRKSRTQGEQTENANALTVDKLMLFIAYVINCSDQVKHKTEKIKIIAKGAEKFLGIKEVSWEQINKRLEIEGKQEGGGIK